MVVKQELYSKSGEYITKTLNVEKIQKQDNVLLAYTKYNNVIWVNGREYPIIFRSAMLRDIQYNRLTEALKDKESEFTLDLEVFYDNKIDITNILLDKNYQIENYLFGVINILMAEQKLTKEQVKLLAAFKDIPISAFKKICNKKLITYNDEYLKTFSKTLRFPKEFHSVSTPLTFWSTLAKLRA